MHNPCGSLKIESLRGNIRTQKDSRSACLARRPTCSWAKPIEHYLPWEWGASDASVCPGAPSEISSIEMPTEIGHRVLCSRKYECTVSIREDRPERVTFCVRRSNPGAYLPDEVLHFLHVLEIEIRRVLAVGQDGPEHELVFRPSSKPLKCGPAHRPTTLTSILCVEQQPVVAAGTA